ncbi:glutamate synthase-related protein [Octadecabacter sp. 1_MG-2023]|uniref:glutamate synthase-related protein n=1 Tax=unclassified Octadecabacter TaxID=196158 RepID=UPI001C0938A9|nr:MULTISPECIES: glutamate synthase-related protein [unclassified Octadecabacter]MBU2994487.1 CDGSH iron-sulfur domain-containing protein [Octadecabacter sp. B2R22]MDO6734220.1 glutamate synthase-related protein [Octadecabacter sp. 1_MG-2023]
MTKSVPIIAAKHPAKVDLEKGKDYYWCQCGMSKSQPFCDGSHAGTDTTPLKFTAEETGSAALCQCKATANGPFCDGTHASLGDLAAGDPSPKPKSDVPTANPTPEEPTVARIHALARDGLSKLGHHGEMGSMGVPRKDLPHWDDIQVLPAQMARKPLLDHVPVTTSVTIGPRAAKPLQLDIPLFVSDMSYGALSEEAKTALSRGAQMAGTGICSGEGGMLPEEQAENSRYFYELASAKFGWDLDLVARVQAFHFKGGQGAKTGTGGHLPGEKVQGKIAEVRGLEPGQAAISPSTFADLETPADFKRIADQVRERSGGIPIGFKLSANHIEDDIDFALEASADYIILDGRGGGTGAAPLIFRDHISVPTIPALARARAHLDAKTGREVSLVITGGLRVAEDFVKAMAMGADAVAVSNSAMQAVGCIAARMCNSNNCPVGVATQKPELRKRLDVQVGAERLSRYFGASVEMMQVLARACGHASLSDLNERDITTWKREMADLSGVRFAGVKR